MNSIEKPFNHHMDGKAIIQISSLDFHIKRRLVNHLSAWIIFRILKSISQMLSVETLTNLFTAIISMMPVL